MDTKKEQGDYPKVTLEHIESRITNKYFFTGADGVAAAMVAAGDMVSEIPTELNRFTFCILRLDNGAIITGENACVHPGNWSAELGKQYAYENAIDKIWSLEGYLLREKLFINKQL